MSINSSGSFDKTSGFYRTATFLSIKISRPRKSDNEVMIWVCISNF